MRGFTLIELIVSLAVFCIIIGAGLPQFGNMVDNHSARRSLYTLKSALLKTRSLALYKRQEVTLCPFKDKKCTDDWSDPLAAFQDINRNLELDKQETLYFKLGNELTFGYWQKKRANRNYIRFTPQGYAFSSATTFLYCPMSKKNFYAKQLVINFQGRVRINNYLTNQGTPHASILPLACP